VTGDEDMNKEDIYIKLSRIFSDRFEIDLKAVPEENFYKHLLGSEFRLAPRDLIYIYLDIEKEFGIAIPDEDIATGGLSTINRMIEIIERQLDIMRKNAV
jgi:acyl carrier protein